MGDQKTTPYVPASKSMKAMTFQAVFLGVIMAIVLGAANAYLGMKVGRTVAATFPAAVVAMAALRIFKGNILELGGMYLIGSFIKNDPGIFTAWR